MKTTFLSAFLVAFKKYLGEFLLFGLKQAWACLFGGLLLFFIILSQYWYPFKHILYRYDFLFIAAVTIQIILLAFKLETLKEARVIITFHIVATLMELFKTSTAIGSWNYPEPALIKVGNVPLFAGFMYSAVGSYIARIWKVFDFKFDDYPAFFFTVLLASGIYLNFFLHHYIFDFRWCLILISFILFGKTKIYFRVGKIHSMPLILGWILVALFIWIAENISTFFNAWLYPSQKLGWHLVSYHKIIAWYLLTIISFVLVYTLHRPERGKYVRSYFIRSQRASKI